MIFVDTAAFLTIENLRDTHHEEALSYQRSCLRKGKPLVTSDYVLDETYTIIRIRAGHTIAVQFGEALRAQKFLDPLGMFLRGSVLLNVCGPPSAARS